MTRVFALLALVVSMIGCASEPVAPPPSADKMTVKPDVSKKKGGGDAKLQMGAD